MEDESRGQTKVNRFEGSRSDKRSAKSITHHHHPFPQPHCYSLSSLAFMKISQTNNSQEKFTPKAHFQTSHDSAAAECVADSVGGGDPTWRDLPSS